MKKMTTQQQHDGYTVSDIVEVDKEGNVLVQLNLVYEEHNILNLETGALLARRLSI